MQILTSLSDWTGFILISNWDNEEHFYTFQIYSRFAGFSMTLQIWRSTTRAHTHTVWSVSTCAVLRASMTQKACDANRGDAAL